MQCSAARRVRRLQSCPCSAGMVRAQAAMRTPPHLGGAALLSRDACVTPRPGRWLRARSWVSGRCRSRHESLPQSPLSQSCRAAHCRGACRLRRQRRPCGATARAGPRACQRGGAGRDESCRRHARRHRRAAQHHRQGIRCEWHRGAARAWRRESGVVGCRRHRGRPCRKRLRGARCRPAALGLADCECRHGEFEARRLLFRATRPRRHHRDRCAGA